MINKIETFSKINFTQIKKEISTNVQKEEKISKIEIIKEQIRNGNYEINIEKTAKFFAKALL